MRALSAISAIAAFIGCMAQPALAAWPDDRPIEIIVGFAPGGSTDIMARGIAPFIQKHLGGKQQPVIINRPGASGEIAVTQIMRANPDGYTVGIVNQPGFAFLPIHRKASYEVKDLALIARVVSDPSVLVAGTKVPFENLNGLMTALKASPSSISAGHNGVGTNGHLALVRLENAAGVKFNNVPFNGTGQQKTALLGNHLDLAFLAASEVMQVDKDVAPQRILAQFSKTRGSTLASVPTTFEQGFAIEMTADRGFAAPLGLSTEIYDRLRRAIEASIADPEYTKAASVDAPFLAYLSGKEWEKQIASERSAYEAIANALPK